MKLLAVIFAALITLLARPAFAQAAQPSDTVSQCLKDYAGFPIKGPIYGVTCKHSDLSGGKTTDISTEIEWCTDPGCNVKKYWRRNCNEGIGCVITWCPDENRQKCVQKITAPPHEIRPPQPAPTAPPAPAVPTDPGFPFNLE